MFTCGLCHQKFTRRDNMNRHKRRCYADLARANGLLHEFDLRTGPPHEHKAQPCGVYPCKHCGKHFPCYNRKRDHQKRCKGFVCAIGPTLNDRTIMQI